MSTPTQTREWLLAEKPVSTVDLSTTFTLTTSPLPALTDNQVLLKVLYISNDPAQRAWIQAGADPVRAYVPPVQSGERMRARAIASVIDSQSGNLKKGDMVTATTGWTEYAVMDAKACSVIQALEGLSVTHYLGALGLTGLTVLYGLQVVRTGPEDAVVVSGAAGATGSMVVQIAKHVIGCRKVIGIAGNEEKCRWVESLGADVCLNYRKEGFQEDLKKATDASVEVYFDNVGGGILDLMLECLARHVRVAACGNISNYNKGDDRVGIENWTEVIMGRLEIKGFVVMDGNFPQLQKEIIEAVQAGKIKLGDESETVVPTKFEQIPETWLRLYSGQNTGKLITKLV